MISAALHCGIDQYPAGNALSKCVFDAQALAKIFDGDLLLDGDATRKTLMDRIKETARKPGAGEWGVLTFSGHGSQAVDRNHDELDGLDETIVSVELDQIIDDEYQKLLAGRNPKSKLLVVCDSCFSGTIARGFSLGRDISDAPKTPVRYLPPSQVQAVPRKAVTNKGPQAALPNVVVMSACTDFEFAYEGEKYGIFTGALVETYKPELTIGAWFRAACKVVAAGRFGAVQHPMLSASKAAIIFMATSRSPDREYE